ncbi:MAG: hypothetical protein AAF492_01755, partial [Verrucomicrobiota bacterium]
FISLLSMLILFSCMRPHEAYAEAGGGFSPDHRERIKAFTFTSGEERVKGWRTIATFLAQYEPLTEADLVFILGGAKNQQGVIKPNVYLGYENGVHYTVRKLTLTSRSGKPVSTFWTAVGDR